MLVSTNGKSYLRGMKKVIVSRNGSFISIQLEREGLTDFFLIDRDGLVEALKKLNNHGDQANVLVNMDQAVNLETLVAEFDVRKNWLRDFLQIWK